ncbi:hypothetical protein Tco_0534140 [Tanacetum coccineum]
MMVQAQQEHGEGSANPTDPQYTPTIAQPSSSQPQKKHKPRKPKKKDTQIPQSSVPSDNIAEEAINEENLPTHSNDPLLSGEDRLKLEELIVLCTNLQNRVPDLEYTKTTQALEIECLKRRVKKLEKNQISRTHGLRRLYKVGLSARVISSVDEGLGEEDASKHERKIHDIDANEDITLENVHDEDMFDTGVFNDEEVFAGQDMAKKEVSIVDPVTTVGEVVTTSNVEVSTASPTTATISTVELTLAQTLAELKSARPKTKGVVMQEPSETTIIPSKDKGKGIMVEEPLKMKKKDQVLFDEQEAIRLQAQFNEEKRIDKVETDYELAQRLQVGEQEELTIEEKSKLFQQLFEKRRKHFATKRAEERRNRSPTKAQQRSIMNTYLKNMAGWKPKDLKNKSFANVQELFEKTMKRVNTFVDIDTELVEGSEIREKESSSKRTGDELEQEPSKKQKMEDDKETAELQSMMEVIPDEEEVAVDAIPLATKPPSIVDWKIIKEGKIGYYQIIRADGNSKRYSSMIQMLKSFDREDLETLWKLVKAKHGYTRPEEGYKRVLWGSSRPPVKRKLASGWSTSHTVRAKASALKDDTPVLSISDDDEGLEDCLELKDATACHLKISAITPPTWKGFLDNHLDVDLLDLYDRCYARQAVVDNEMNRRSRELLEVIEKLRGEADVMRARELAREEEGEGLRAKCEAAMTDFDKNPAILLLREKMSLLAAEATEALLRQEIEEVKHDRREVVSKVVPYTCMELLHSDDMGRLVGKLVSSAITFGRCRAYEQVARMKEPLDLSKVMGYRPSFEKEHTQASNDLATATFSWLNEYVADASASIEALLSKKPPTL